MVRVLNTAHKVDIMKECTVTCKNRMVTVTGPRGTLKRDFRHAQLQMSVIDNTFRVELWFGNRKQVALCKTIVSAVRNMMKGVTEGFEYRMRSAHAHFPILVNAEGNKFEIRGYLGEKRIRTVVIPEGIKVSTETGTKDEIAITGSDVNTVSQFAASIRQAARPRNKDIRMFLDGIYVSKSGAIGQLA